MVEISSMDNASCEELTMSESEHLRKSMETLRGDASGIMFLVTQLKGIQKHNEMVEDNVKSRSQELEIKEKELQSLSSDFKKRVQTFEKEKSEAGDLNKQVKECAEELKLITMLIQERSEELVGMEKRHKEILETICRSSSEMGLKAKEIKAAETEASDLNVRFRQEIEDKEKDLDMLKNQIESEEKKLVMLKRETEEVTDLKKKDLELTLSKIEESGKQLAAVNEQLESLMRQLYLKSKELGEIERELKFKKHMRQMSTVLVKREKQPAAAFISQQNAAETEPIDALMLHEVSAFLSPHEVSSVLRASPNPAKLVLELVQEEIREGLTLQDTFLEILVLLFEELTKIQRPDESQLQLKATELASLWKENITIIAPKSSLEALAFLLFIMAYGLKTLINEEETALLVSSIAHYEQGPTLFKYLSLNPIIPEFVEELIKKSLYIPAVRLICLFKLNNELSFSPSELLKKEIINFSYALENRTNESSQAKEKDCERLRAILELVADYKVKIDLPGDLMAKLMVEGEREAPLVRCSVEHITSSSNPQAEVKKEQLGQMKTVLVKHNGVEEDNLGVTLQADVNSMNETSNSKHPPVIYTYQRRMR